MKPKVMLALVAVMLFCSIGAAEETLRWASIDASGHRDFNALLPLDLDVVSGLNGYNLDVLATDSELAKVSAMGFGYSLLDSDIDATMKARFGNSMGAYYTYTTIGTELAAWQASYPNLMKWWVLGQGHEGRDVRIMKIAANVDYDDPTEPELLIFAGDHAREIMTPAVVMKLAEYLLTNYGTDPWVTEMLDHRQIYIIPTKNPDGLQYVEDHNYGMGSPSGWWRKNRRFNNPSYGVDLNRNYPYMWGYDGSGSSGTPSSDTYRGPFAASEPETQALLNWVETRNITFEVNYHTYGQYLIYPFGYVNQPVPEPDQSTIIEMIPGMLTNLSHGPNPGPSSYPWTYGRAPQLLYPVNGQSDDYFYGEQEAKPKSWAFCYELNTSSQGGFGPSDTWIQPTFDAILPSMKWYIENCKTYAIGVDLSYFQAYSKPGAVELRWAAENDSEIVGYNVTRRPAGKDSESLSDKNWTRVNNTIITGTSPFTFTDATAEPGIKYSYRLESIESSGRSGNNGPVQGTAGSKTMPTALAMTMGPNPSNGPVTFGLTVPANFTSAPHLAIYDLSGRLVRDMPVSVGVSSLVWDGRDASGNSCAAGVYTAHLSSGNAHLNKRVVISH